jgi:hypothetical protein
MTHGDLFMGGRAHNAARAHILRSFQQFLSQPAVRFCLGHVSPLHSFDRRHEALIANGFAFRKAGESLDFENTHKPTLSINYSYLNYKSRNDIRRINPQTRPNRAWP